MAEQLLRRELARRGAAGQIAVRSAGVAAYARDGSLISLDTRLALREVGIELDQGATSIALRRHPELIESADLVIAMTEQQARDLAGGFAAAAGRPVHTFRGLAGEAGDIDDPFEKGEEAFAACRDEIARLAPRIAARLVEE